MTNQKVIPKLSYSVASDYKNLFPGVKLFFKQIFNQNKYRVRNFYELHNAIVGFFRRSPTSRVQEIKSSTESYVPLVQKTLKYKPQRSTLSVFSQRSGLSTSDMRVEERRTCHTLPLSKGVGASLNDMDFKESTFHNIETNHVIVSNKRKEYKKKKKDCLQQWIGGG